MNQELRERALLPVLIPIGAIVVTEIVVFSMSRILLAAGTEGAVVIALGVTLAILVGASVIASAKRMRTSSIAGLLSVGLIVTVAAGAVAMQHGPAEHETEASRPTLQVSADDLVFDTDTLELSSGGTVIEFDNVDSQPHNIAIYPTQGALNDPLFKGQIIQADQNISYEVPAIRPGEYYFHCDVHPTMNGTATVSDVGPPAPAQGN